MKIIIIGDGKVGYTLAESLSKENHDITIIDKDAQALKRASDYLDVMCIKGNGVSTKILQEAGVKKSDLLIAATSSDEMNMVCCLTAKKLGAAHTVARIRDPEYAGELSVLKAELGLDMVINPELAAAGDIARLIKFPPAVNVETFSKGRVEMVEIKVTQSMSVAGMLIKDIAVRISSLILIGAVVRNGDVFVPDGNFQIKEGDTIYIVGKPSRVYEFCKHIGIHIQRIKNVMIMGGGRIAYYLTPFLEEMDVKVKIIEIDEERCKELSELLPRALIIHGDGTDEKLLKSENLEGMGAFISVTGRDEDNIISALLAKQSAVTKVIAKINRISNFDVIKGMGLDSVVSPKLITANYIVRYVRGLQNAMGSQINTLYKMIEDRVEAIEFIADANAKYNNVPLKDMNINKGILVAAIVRNNEIIIPHGNDVIKPGDSVILITKDKTVADLVNVLD